MLLGNEGMGHSVTDILNFPCGRIKFGKVRREIRRNTQAKHLASEG